jgi:hypothetical protein
MYRAATKTDVTIHSRFLRFVPFRSICRAKPTHAWSRPTAAAVESTPAQWRFVSNWCLTGVFAIARFRMTVQGT